MIVIIFVTQNKFYNGSGISDRILGFYTLYVATATATPDLLYLKAEIIPSQDVSCLHQAWVFTTTEGVVQTAGCSCIAGLGKTCSHAGSIL